MSCMGSGRRRLNGGSNEEGRGLDGGERRVRGTGRETGENDGADERNE